MTERVLTEAERFEIREIAERCKNREMTDAEASRLAAIGEACGIEPPTAVKALADVMGSELRKRDKTIEALSDRIAALEQAQTAIKASISNLARGKGANDAAIQ